MSGGLCSTDIHIIPNSLLLTVAGTLVYIGNGDILETADASVFNFVEACGLPPDAE